MAKFSHHEPCSSCGSRDNLGRYSDGSAYCFGCGYTERGSKSPFVGERDGKTERDDDRVRIPEDATGTIGDPRAVEWLAKANVTMPEAIRAGILWSPFWEQLLIPFYDRDGQLCCIQAKNFNTERARKAKYYNTGDKNESFTKYGVHASTLVLTEDALSAIRCGRFVSGMPLLGTSITRDKLAILRKQYDRLIVWLDADKWRESREIADAGKLLGFTTKTIYTEQDPKSYSDEEIKEFLL